MRKYFTSLVSIVVSIVRIVRATDLQSMQNIWNRVVAPDKRGEGRYGLGSGPALHIVEAAENRIVSLVLEVAFLQKTCSFLEKAGLRW